MERLFDRIHQKESGFQRIRSGCGVYFCPVSFFAVRLFYNFWNYEIESVVLEEGNWQGRISGAFEEDKVSEIENFANVKTAIINEDLSDDQTLVVDICFDNMRAVYQDMPLIAQQLGVPETSVSYHESLLSSYFINDPQDSNPPLLMAFYLFVLLLVSVSLI